MDATSNTEPIRILNGKKVSKPLMEKKRRARINKCLDQLKTLLETCYSNNIRKRKLEKADILELTVRHMKQLQRGQRVPAMNCDFAEFQAGFRSCLAGVGQFLMMADTAQSSGPRTPLTLLSSHLQSANSLDNMNLRTMDSDTRAEQSVELDGHQPANMERANTDSLLICVKDTSNMPKHKYEQMFANTNDTTNSKYPVLKDTAVKVQTESQAPSYLTSGSYNTDELRYGMPSFDSYWRPW